MAEKSSKNNSAQAGGVKKRLKNLKLGRRTVWSVLTHNWGMKLLSVFFAFILWGYVISETNPRRPVVFADIPIVLRGVDTLRGRKLAILNEDEKSQVRARVELSVAYRDLNSIAKGDVTIIADVSAITSEGTHTVELRAIPSTGEVREIEPKSVSIVVEPMVSRQVPVRLKTVGKLSDGYWLGDAELSSRQVIIQGAQSEVSKVSAALVELPIGNRTSGINDALGFMLVDQDDIPITAGSVVPQVDSVIVTIPVLPTKQVPISTAGALEGAEELAQYRELSQVTITPAMVTIAAEQDVLDGIDEVLVQPVSVAGASGDITQITELVAPADIAMMDTKRVGVTAHIQQTQRSVALEDVPIQRYPISAGQTAQVLGQRAQITISGLADVVAGFDPQSITLYVDESNLAPGIHALPVQYYLTQPDGLSVQVFPKTVEVEIPPA